MKDKTPKKLSLTKETLRTLTPSELREVGGGYMSRYCSDYCSCCGCHHHSRHHSRCC